MAKLNCNFISYTLKRAVDITVIIPSTTIPESFGMFGGSPSHKITDKFPVLYLLHGYGNNHTTWTGYTNVELYAEERNIAVVMLSAENKSYVNHPEGDQFYDFIASELPEFICNMFPISEDPKDTYIAGLSMGGYGALVHGLNRPTQFAALGSLSGAIEINPSALSGGKEKSIDPQFDPSSLAKHLFNNKETFPKTYIACGEADSLYEINTKFKNQLLEMGVDLTWVSLPKFGHEWRFWDLQIEAFLDWIPRSDAYAAKDKRKV